MHAAFDLSDAPITTARGLRAVAVIGLRGLAEHRGFDERAAAEGAGMSYVSLPVEGAAGVTYENAAELDRLLAELPKPVLLHCSAANRAGALLALRAKLSGADSAAALEREIFRDWDASADGLRPRSQATIEGRSDTR